MKYKNLHQTLGSITQYTWKNIINNNLVKSKYEKII